MARPAHFIRADCGPCRFTVEDMRRVMTDDITFVTVVTRALVKP